MAASESYLSSYKYGYDFVVAVTQISINATMKTFMDSRQEPVVEVCYVADHQGRPQQIDYQALQNLAGGTDPFNVPDGASSDDSAVKNLFQARFMFGFRAEIGIPPMDDPTSLPDIVVLGTDTTSVQYNMYCSDFTIVHLNPGGFYEPPSFMKRSQPKNHPWVFTSNVNLSLSTVANADYGSLPPVVQNQIKNMSSSAFSVQQILFDLTNATLSGRPTIGGMDSGSILYMIAQQYFVGAYFDQLKKDGQPLLGCSIVHQKAAASSMKITNMNLKVCPYLDGSSQPYPKPDSTQQSLATLNYLCATDGHSLPNSVAFNWNWVSPDDMSNHDGILSVNRNTLRDYFQTNLASYIPKACIKPYAQVKADFTIDEGLGTDMSCAFAPGQAATMSLPEGSTVLKYYYNDSSYDSAGANGCLGSLNIVSTFVLTVEFVGKTIIITQQLTFYVAMKKKLAFRDGNIFDKRIVDTYTIDVDGKGVLKAVQNGVTTDYSVPIKIDGVEDYFFTHMNKISAEITEQASEVASSNFKDIPLSIVQNYVFPGGKTFIFKEAKFSNNQDLFASINYADVTAPPHTVPVHAASLKMVRLGATP